MKHNSLIKILEATNQYKILQRVPESLPKKSAIQLDLLFHQNLENCLSSNNSLFIKKSQTLAIIDLETTGLDPRNDEIIEIGILIVSFNSSDNQIVNNNSGDIVSHKEGEVKEIIGDIGNSIFKEIIFSNNQLQQPKTPISAETTKITRITNDDVKDKAIDWKLIFDKLKDVDIIICHNAAFDRNFMELQTPDYFIDLIKSKYFGCSMSGIKWKEEFNYESNKLEYLNLKMGYFYDGHRALSDCWATLNLLIQEKKAFKLLQQSVEQKEVLICAVNANFHKKDDLKIRGYRWSDGNGGLPKSWWVIIPENKYEEELFFLQNEIYGSKEIKLPSKVVTAKEKYSYRVEEIG